MSVSTQIDRLENAKSAIKTAIEGKGVTVPSATKLDEMAPLIESIAPMLQSKSVTVTSNGTLNITSDSGYDGLSEAVVNVDVSASKGTCSVSIENPVCDLFYIVQRLSSSGNVTASSGTIFMGDGKTFSDIVTDSIIVVAFKQSAGVSPEVLENIVVLDIATLSTYNLNILKAPSDEGASGLVSYEIP